MAINPQAPRHERQRYRIDQLMEPSNKAKLKGVARLHAALFVGQLFDRALAAGKSRESIEARIGARLGEIGVASRDFRAERWRLPKSVTEINAEVKLEWDRRPEPQRKESVYYHVVQVLCELLGEDPLTAQIALRDLIEGGASDSGSRAEEVEPAHRVALLVRHMARAFAVEQDLAALWTQARMLNTGSDLLRGPVIVPVSERQGGQSWRGRYSMSAPCPSVHLVRVPLMTANTTFDVSPIDGEARGSICADGSNA